MTTFLSPTQKLRCIKMYKDNDEDNDEDDQRANKANKTFHRRTVKTNPKPY